MDFEALWDRTAAAAGKAYQDLIGFAIGTVEALLVAVVAIVVARWLRRRVRRSLGRTRLDRNVVALAAHATVIATYVVAASVALALLGASWTAVGAILGAGTVALSLALQDVLRNFVAGIYVLVERPFAIGDRIKLRDIEGTVEAIEIRTTWLRTEREERVLVPNATVFAEVLTNRSVADRTRTTVTLSGVPDPIGTVPDAVREALAGLDGLGERPPVIELVAAGAAGAEVTVRLAHERGADLAPVILARLRARFPDAALRVERV